MLLAENHSIEFGLKILSRGSFDAVAVKLVFREDMVFDNTDAQVRGLPVCQKDLTGIGIKCAHLEHPQTGMDADFSFAVRLSTPAKQTSSSCGQNYGRFGFNRTGQRTNPIYFPRADWTIFSGGIICCVGDFRRHSVD